MSHLFNHGYINECDYVLEQLEALEDGELAPRIQDRVLTHLPLCAGCRAARDHKRRALGSARAALAGHPRIAAPAGFDARVWTAIEQRRSRPVTLRSRLSTWATRPIPRLLGSACFGLGVALAVGGVASPDVPAPRSTVAALPLDEESSLAMLVALEQGSLARRFRAQAELQVLAPEPQRDQQRQPQRDQQTNQQPASQRRSQENLWTRPARASRGASSSDAGSLC